MSDSDDQDDEAISLDRSDDAIVADPVTPKCFQIAGERFAETARVLGRGDALAQIPKDRSLCYRAELAQIARCVAIKLDTPNGRLAHRVNASR